MAFFHSACRVKMFQSIFFCRVNFDTFFGFVFGNSAVTTRQQHVTLLIIMTTVYVHIDNYGFYNKRKNSESVIQNIGYGIVYIIIISIFYLGYEREAKKRRKIKTFDFLSQSCIIYIYI